MNILRAFLSRTAPHSWAGCMPSTNDERRAAWAALFYGGGYHHRTRKQRIRIIND